MKLRGINKNSVIMQSQNFKFLSGKLALLADLGAISETVIYTDAGYF